MGTRFESPRLDARSAANGPGFCGCCAGFDPRPSQGLPRAAVRAARGKCRAVRSTARGVVAANATQLSCTNSNFPHPEPSAFSASNRPSFASAISRRAIASFSLWSRSAPVRLAVARSILSCETSTPPGTRSAAARAVLAATRVSASSTKVRRCRLSASTARPCCCVAISRNASTSPAAFSLSFGDFSCAVTCGTQHIVS